MARARNIKPSLFKNEVLGVEDPLLTILFTSLWCLADKRGRLEDRPLRIKAETFPYREGIDINGYLTELSRLEFIQRYVTDGIAVIQIINFEKHQNPHHTEKESELPEYSINTDGYGLTVNEPLNNSDTPADSLNLIPDSFNPHPDSFSSDAEKSAPPAKVDIEKELQEACKETWKFYTDAFFNRYGTEPVRNSKVNSQVKQFVKRIGYAESPLVAASFVSNNTQYYVSRGHSVDCLLADAEKIRTEWATGNVMTNTRANQIDKSQANKSAVSEAMQLLGATS